MRPVQLGLPLPTIQAPMNKAKSTWNDYQAIARQAEEIGFDTVWIPDELLWQFAPDAEPIGTWECVAFAGAVAAVTNSINVGTWVLSALHRNPGLTVKVAEAIDDVSGGRFIFGLGAGHSGGQGKAFGYPPDKVVGRYEEALRVIVPAIREGEVTFSGEFHSAFNQVNLPRGPQGRNMPLMLAGHGPRTVGMAVAHADIWSGFATTSSLPEAFIDMIHLVDKTCEEQGRDPGTLGKSIGVFLELTETSVVEQTGLGVPLRGTPAEIADRVHDFAEMGVTMLELIPAPFNDESTERLADLVQILDA